MEKVRIGVMGAYRGSSMINFGLRSGRAEVVAICDKNVELIEAQKSRIEGSEKIAFYERFDDFIQHDMDAVVLANYANEHAPFAIRCLDRGLNVYSEVLPCQTLAEAVALIEAVERSGKIYAYGENYCYMPAPAEMRRLYRAGRIGEFEYGEGEYIHDCESIWPSITYGERDHWRNNMFANYYCTHSIGPLIHITGLRPVRVVGFESLKTERRLNLGSKAGLFGMELITLENGGIVKSIHGGLRKGSIWYSVYGDKGTMESAREITRNKDIRTIFVNAEGGIETYEVVNADSAKSFGHGGSDYYCMDNFVRKVLGDPEADTISVYEAMDMFLPGLLAYRSVLSGGAPVEVPDLRDPAVREKFRHDTACTDPKVAGDQLLPTCSRGTPEVPDEVYEKVRRMWEEEKANNGTYRASVFNSGRKKS